MGKTLAALLGSFFLFNISNPLTAENNSPNSLRSIVIQGDEDCRNKTEEALALLQEKAGAYFGMVLENIGMVQCVEEHSGMHVDSVLPIYHAGRETVNAGAVWYASTIVHDACHSRLYNDYLDFNGNEAPYEVWTGKEAELTCLREQYKVLIELDADEWTLQHVQNMMNYAYWEVPYEDRNW